MSRLIVKNLPKNTTEAKLRKLFEHKGVITDIQLKYTPEGKFRQFAFIGYQNEHEADEAIKEFHNSFMNTSKISVQSCATLGDANKPKAWSKYAPDSTAFKKTHSQPAEDETEVKSKKKKDKKKKKTDDAAELLTQYKDDPMFEEFLNVHAPEETKKLKKVKESETITQKNDEENNDSAIESDHASKNDSESSENEESAETETNKLANEKISDLEYMKQLINKKEMKPRTKTKKEPKNLTLFTLKMKGLPYNAKKKEIKQFFSPSKPFSIRIPTKIHGIAYVGFKTEKESNKALLKDRSFIAGKRISVVKYVKEEAARNSEASESNPHKNRWVSQEEALKNEEDIAESGKIFLRNLAYVTSEADIEALFAKFGPISEINLPLDATTKKLKGFGTVTFLMPEHAAKAYSELDGSVLNGRMLHLLPGKSRDNDVPANGEEYPEESSNYKKKKASKEKSQASSRHNWNSLFLGHDAVAEVIADNYNTTKENVLQDQGAAVRLALGETEIVAQTRKYLENEGVVLDAFTDSKAKRSKTIILVKNLPSKTEQSEIGKLFQKYGMVARIILPPSGITALVEFVEGVEARKAFTSLAYTKFKNVPLYLEWAPENSLISKPEIQNGNGAGKSSIESLEKDEKVNEENSKEEEDEEEPEPDTTLFVKNLNFKTTDDDLKKHFEPSGRIFYATVATKKDPANPGEKLSMGYGFVRFYYKNAADKALKSLQQSVLDGKSLELKRSERTLSNEVQTVKKKQQKVGKQTGTKILVRNIPFQANIKEIRDLFTTFGEIKALRLPKKMSLDGGQHRGFAFVDYTTNSDAKRAFEALSQSTHLYGRRLVLEWASTEEGVEEIRKRTAEHFGAPKATKKSKKGVFELEEKNAVM